LVDNRPVYSYSSVKTGMGSRLRELRHLLSIHRADPAAHAEAVRGNAAEIEALTERHTGVRIEGRDVLDLGCGQQFKLVQYFALRNEVTGIDYNVIPRGFDVGAYLRLLRTNGPTRLAKTLLRKALGADAGFSRALRAASPELTPRPFRLLQMDAESLGFPDESFDFVYSRSVFEHLPRPRVVLEEVRRVLRPGGACYLGVHLYTSDTGSPVASGAGTSNEAPGNGERTPASRSYTTHPATPGQPDLIPPDTIRKREKFIPVTRFALMDRLTRPRAWPHGDHVRARQFFQYLSYYRHQLYQARLLELDQTYEPFSPDSDLLMTRQFTPKELRRMQVRFIREMQEILVQANYEEISPEEVAAMMNDTHYGLDLHVDFSIFEECLIFYRGATNRRDHRRRFQRFFLKEEFDVPIYQRLFILFKIKPIEQSQREFIEREKISDKEALKKAKKQRAHLPAEVTHDNIYMKLFKNIPRSDVEMVFPNTEVRYRLLDKIKLGGGSAVGIGVSAFAAAGKLGAALVNPIAAVTLVGGLGAAIFRQAMNFVNTKQRYMVIMAQNLYFHSMADNRGVMIKLADRAADEDVKEEMLLYSVLAKETANRRDLHKIDEAIEKYLLTTFDHELDFDLEDALERLIGDGVVTELADGTLLTKQPEEAAKHLDTKWDLILDELPDLDHSDEHEGREIESGPARTPRRAAPQLEDVSLPPVLRPATRQAPSTAEAKQNA